MTVQFTDSQEKWIEFDELKSRLIVKPSRITPLGLTSIEVTLDDSKDTSVYYMNIWVIENPEGQEPAGPKPEPVPDPDTTN